jgi:Protein of unknown function (DUF4065)
MEQLNRDKFKALVHYICDKASDPSVLGAIKLNKVLWYSDSIQYLVSSRSITGETYVKRQHGPVPRHIVGVVETLVTEGKIARGRVDHFGFYKNEYIAIAPSDVSMFTSDEIKLVDAAFDHVCLNHTARSVSEETHGIIWQLADMGEEIPLATAFAANVGEIDETDIAWGKSYLGIAA